MDQLATLWQVKDALGIGQADAADDLWLANALEQVSDAIESQPVTGRWFRSRGATTYLFDSDQVEAGGLRLRVPMGLQAITYLGVAWSDQPDDGTGTYSEITRSVYLNPPLQLRQRGDPAYAIELGRQANLYFPTYPARRCVKVTGTWGYAAVPPRVAQVAIAAVVRAYRARSSGGADYAIVGADGGMKILRDLAPAELAELRATYRVPAVA